MKKLFFLLLLIPLKSLAVEGLDENTCRFIGKNLHEKGAAIRKGIIPYSDHCGRYYDRPGYGISCDGSIKTQTRCLELVGSQKTINKISPKISEEPTILANNLESYKETCQAIGFKPKTENFGSCVLKLKRKADAKQTQTQTTNSQQNQNIQNNQQLEMQSIQQAQEAANAHFAEIQRQNAEAQRRYQAELASYRRELAAAEKARERARKDAASDAMIELGLGIASGKYDSRVNSYRAPTIQAPAPPPLNPYSRYRMNFPDNSYIDCTYNSQTRNANCY